MKKKQSRINRIIFLLVVCITWMSFSTVYAGELPEGVKQVWTSVEGNVKYYVKVGDKVKKGTPLFYIENGDNNPAMFWKLEHKIEYYRKLYQRRVTLIKTHAVSEESVDNALQNLIDAEDELTLLISIADQGFYVAPFDCEITKLLYLQGSGIGDGNPAINIKCTDKDYKFEPPKVNPKILELLKKCDELLKNRYKELDPDNLNL